MKIIHKYEGLNERYPFEVLNWQGDTPCLVEVEVPKAQVDLYCMELYRRDIVHLEQIESPGDGLEVWIMGFEEPYTILTRMKEGGWTLFRNEQNYLLGYISLPTLFNLAKATDASLEEQFPRFMSLGHLMKET